MSQENSYSPSQFQDDITRNIQRHIHVIHQPIFKKFTKEEQAGTRKDLHALYEMQKSS